MNPVKNSPVFLKLVTADSIAANWVIYLSVNDAILSSIFIISSLYSVIDELASTVLFASVPKGDVTSSR